LSFCFPYKKRGRISIIYYSFLNPINPTLQPAVLIDLRGFGSGIKRALEAWPEIDFIDDRVVCLFTATVHRKAQTSSRIMSALPGDLGKTSGKILAALASKTKSDYCRNHIRRS